MRNHLVAAGLGLSFGFALCFIGFTDFGQVRAMFALEDLRLLFTFAGGVGLSFAAFRVLQARDASPLFTPGTLPGAVLFGLGWALTGTCPGVVFAQLGEGRFYVLATLAGIALGMFTYGRVHARFFRWPAQSCGE
ncbi:MAG: DUF6691 family protein [Myxococcota bacterium]